MREKFTKRRIIMCIAIFLFLIVIYAKVEVTVSDGKMTDIAILEHRQERGKAAEAVISDMLAEQKIDVDAVSGATNSSTVIKKAVENALGH